MSIIECLSFALLITGGGALLGLAVLGGPAAFKILGKLSRKFRRACGSGNSFDGETLVATEDGLKAISQIKIGDKVWAYNEETGENTLQEVVHLIAGEGNKELVDITLTNSEVITATTGHPFYVNGEWLDAGELTDASQLFDLNGEVLAIADIKQYSKEEKVYNLTVDNDHTYYVGDSGVLNHNVGRCNEIEPRVWEHIFQGERKSGRRFVGLHHVEAGHVPSNALIEVTKRGSAGFYEANVWFKLASGNYREKLRRASTFFPDSWSKSKVQSTVRAGFIKALAEGKKNGVFEYPMRSILSENIKGVYLQIIIKNGKLDNAFPVIK